MYRKKHGIQIPEDLLQEEIHKELARVAEIMMGSQEFKSDNYWIAYREALEWRLCEFHIVEDE